MCICICLLDYLCCLVRRMFICASHYLFCFCFTAICNATRHGGSTQYCSSYSLQGWKRYGSEWGICFCSTYKYICNDHVAAGPDCLHQGAWRSGQSHDESALLCKEAWVISDLLRRTGFISPLCLLFLLYRNRGSPVHRLGPRRCHHHPQQRDHHALWCSARLWNLHC